jgi:hypothetical protein
VNNSIRILVVASTLSSGAGFAAAKTSHEMEPGATLRIRLYNAAHVKPQVLGWARAETTRIFKAGGINATWELPAVEAAEDRGIDMSANSWNTDSRRYLVVRITRGTAPSVAPGALGFALPFAQTGAHASIFYDRIEVLARLLNRTQYMILGHAMAHEIGHVLLRSSEHSAAGLMQARWNEASWRLGAAGLLSFLPAEKAAMRETVRAFANPLAARLGR